jgi:hypothetical protein
MRNLQGADGPKIRFHETIKGLEQRLGDHRIPLNSFVVSVTPHNQVGWWEVGMTQKDFENHHILLCDAQKRAHLETVFRKLLRL